MGNLFDTKDTTAEFATDDIESNKVICGVSYITPLFFLPLIVCPNSAFGKFHANQALLLFIASAAAGVVNALFTVLKEILESIPLVGTLFSVMTGLITFALGVFIFVLFIMGLVNGLSGKAKELPIIGKISIIK